MGQNYWSVGDCKEVTMNGKVSDNLTLTNYTAWVYIIGFNHNPEKEGNGITFQGFKATNKGTDVCLAEIQYGGIGISGTYFNINNGPSNTGGWAACLMRKNIMPLIKAALPADLQAVIKTSTIYTDNTGGGTAGVVPTTTQDDVFLLAEYEVFGTSTYASSQEPNYLKQYAYYSAGNSKVKYKHNNTSSAADWWERSPYSESSSGFCMVAATGIAEKLACYYKYGVSPCFKV